MEKEEYDIVVLGSGEAGKFIAWTLAEQGERAIVIEQKYTGLPIMALREAIFTHPTLPEGLVSLFSMESAIPAPALKKK
jgi:choline dehydrogenase-like flavoprotein